MEPTADPVNLTGDEVKPYPHGSNAGYGTTTGTGSYASTWGRNTDAPTTSLSAREMDQSRTPFLSTLPPPPASNATSYPRSVNPPSTAGQSGQSPIDENADYVNPFTGSGGPRIYGEQLSTNVTPVISSAGSGGPSSSVSTSQSAQGTETSSSPPPRGGVAKAAGVALPFTARQPTASSATSTSFRSPQRMYREGRDYDMGPVIPPEQEQESHPHLPPDYQQAIEPLPGQNPYSPGG